jgi:hypothetical protein
VLVNVEDDPAFSPLSLHRVHFQLGIFLKNCKKKNEKLKKSESICKF